MRLRLFRNQRGISLIEVMLALVVMGVMSPMIVNWVDMGATSTAQKIAAAQIGAISDAAKEYVKGNYASLVTATTPSISRKVTVADLKAGGYLPPSVSATNPWGQTIDVYVTEPTTGNLQALVLTSGGTGNPASDPKFANQTVPGAAAMIGASGGHTPTGTVTGQTSTTIQGAYGGWSVDLTGTDIPQPGAGHLAAVNFFNDGEIGTDYLYRKAIPGQPELNQMNTALDMTTHDINNAATVNAAKVNLPSGDSLTIGASNLYGDTANTAVRQDGYFAVQHQDGTGAETYTTKVIDSGNSAYYVDPNGMSNVNRMDASQVRATIYYDSNNPAYYVDPASTSNTNEVVSNISRSSIFYDKDNGGYYVDPNVISNLNRIDAADIRSSIYYDKDNTGYFLDPNGMSNVNRIDGTEARLGFIYDKDDTNYYLNPNGTSKVANVNANHITLPSGNSLQIGSSSFYGNGTDSAIRQSGNLYVSTVGGTPRSVIASSFRDGDNPTYYVDPSGTSNINAINVASMSSPIYYDSNNPAFYVDPNSTSIMNVIRASYFSDRDNSGYYVDPNGMSNVNRIDGTQARFSIFYDKDNTSYYLNPNGYSRVSNLTADTVTSTIFKDLNNPAYYVDPASGSNLNDIRTNYIRSSIFYDKDDVSFYLNPAGTSNLSNLTAGTITASSFVDKENSSYYVNPGGTSMLNSVRANIFYDRLNTAYYMQPSATSNFNTIQAVNFSASKYLDKDDVSFYVDPAGFSNQNFIKSEVLMSPFFYATDKIYFGGETRTTWPTIPSRAVVPFWAYSCPTGWREANGNSSPDLRGTFVRGAKGNYNGRDAARAVGSYQADNFKSHTHTYGNAWRGGGWNQYDVTSSSPSHTYAYSATGSTGGTETRPKNVALLYCIKD